MTDLIERAARALWDEPGWEQATHEQREYHREAAERALSAVAPLIAAQALRDAADELRRMDDGRTGGYYDAGRHIIRLLDTRADEIAGDDS